LAEVAGFEEFVLAKDDPGTKPTPDDRLKRTNMTQNINNWTDFQMPSRLNVETETLTERYGKFFAQPFERGFGTTIGNSIRRALLPSIEESSARRSEVPIVVPNPRSTVCAEDRPWRSFSVSLSSARPRGIWHPYPSV